MSRSRLDKLKQLLSRVEQRRAAPRLAVVAANGAASVRLAPVAPEPAVRLREVPPLQEPASSLEQALIQEVPSSIPPPPRVEARGPARERQDEARGPTRAAEGEAPIPTSLPPTLHQAELKPPTSTVPPAPIAPAPEAMARAGTEVLPPVPLRVAPSPAVPFDSAVQVVSSPRIDAPRSFGELLEQSLALRPRNA